MEEIAKKCPTCKEQKELYHLLDTHVCCGVEEIYADMLKRCFDIEITEESSIQELCETCILKLREAYYFKQEILSSLEELNKQVSIQIEYLDDMASEQDLEQGDVEIKSMLDPETGVMKYFLETSVNKVANGLNSKKSIQMTKENVSTKRTNVTTKKQNEFAETTYTRESTKIMVDMDTSYSIESQEKSSDFTCSICSKDYGTQGKLKQHMKTHMEGPFSCQYCDQLFAKVNTRNAHHWRVHKTGDPYVCSHCGERFTTFHKRLKHLQDVHGKTEPQYPCPHCDRKYFYSGARSTHIRFSHMRERNKKCPKCPMAFAKLRYLLSHLATAHSIGEKKFECPVCSKRFYRASSLRYHLKTHKTYRCDLCGADFTDKKILRYHFKCHEMAAAAVKEQSEQNSEANASNSALHLTGINLF